MIDKVQKFMEKYGRPPSEIDPDYLEMLEMGRFRILGVPDVAPAKCANCGASKDDGRKYIDIGRHVEWYGAIFFCSNCLFEIATAVGLFDSFEAKITDLNEALLDKRDLMRQGRVIEDKLNNFVEEVNGYLGKLRSISNDSVTHPSSLVQHDAQSNGGGSEKTNQAPARTEQRTSKSNSSGRSEDLPSLTSLLNS